MNILVTGGSGFIASHLVDRLIEEGNFVINIDKLDYNSYDNTTGIPNKYKFIKGNINNKELILFILNEYSIQVIYNLAAQTHVDNSFYNSVQFTIDNICGTHNLLECVKEYNEKSSNPIVKFIHMSTDEVYGPNHEGTKKNENSLLIPTNPYSATKAAAELLVSSYYYSFKLPIIIVRCNNVFGPRQYPVAVIPAFIYNLLNEDKCYIHGKGETIRHFIYIDNVIDALMCIYTNGEINEIYNIATEEYYNILDLAKKIINKLKGKNVDYNNYIEYIEDRNFNDFRYAIDSKKLENLGYSIRVSFEEGLKKTIDYFKN